MSNHQESEKWEKPFASDRTSTLIMAAFNLPPPTQTAQPQPHKDLDFIRSWLARHRHCKMARDHEKLREENISKAEAGC